MEKIIQGWEEETILLNDEIEKVFEKIKPDYEIYYSKENEIEERIMYFFSDVKKKIIKKLKNFEFEPKKITFSAYSDGENFLYVLKFKEFEFKKSLNTEALKLNWNFAVESYAKVVDDLLNFFSQKKEIRVNPEINPERFSTAVQFLPWEKEEFEFLVKTNKPHLIISKKNNEVEIEFLQKTIFSNYSDFFYFLKDLEIIKKIKIRYLNKEDCEEQYTIKFSANRNFCWINFKVNSDKENFHDFFNGLNNLSTVFLMDMRNGNINFSSKYGMLNIENGKLDFTIKNSLFNDVTIRNSVVIKFNPSETMLKEMIIFFESYPLYSELMYNTLFNDMKLKENFSIKEIFENNLEEKAVLFLWVYSHFFGRRYKKIIFSIEDMFIIKSLKKFLPPKEEIFLIGNIKFINSYFSEYPIIVLKTEEKNIIKFLVKSSQAIKDQGINFFRIQTENIELYYEKEGYLFDLYENAEERENIINEIKEFSKTSNKKIKIAIEGSEIIELY